MATEVIGAPFFCSSRRYHTQVGLTQTIQKGRRGNRFGEFGLDGNLIQSSRCLVRSDGLCRKFGLCLGIDHAVQIIDNRLSIEGCAIVELDPLPELEGEHRP